MELLSIENLIDMLEAINKSLDALTSSRDSDTGRKIVSLYEAKDRITERIKDLGFESDQLAF